MKKRKEEDEEEEAVEKGGKQEVDIDTILFTHGVLKEYFFKKITMVCVI